MENNTEHAESPSQPETLSKDIPSEIAPLDDNSLKVLYDDLAKRDIENRQELDRLRSLLQDAEEKVSKSEQDKGNMDNMSDDIIDSKHELVGLVSDLRQSLALLQSENATISQGKKEYYLKAIKLQTEIDTEHHQNESLKLQVSDLQLKLKTSNKKEEDARKSLLAAENELKSQTESKQREHDVLLKQKNDTEKERDALYTTVQSLTHELTTHKNDIQYANERAKAADERSQQLETSLATLKKHHDELVEVYEKQRLEAEEKIANFTADVDRTQHNATVNKTQLELENKTLKTQLSDALERLQVSRNSLDKLFGKSTTTNDISTTPSGASGNVLKLMKQYEDTGKQWDEVYSDFFQLQDSTSRLTDINNELTTTNRQLVREKDDQQQYHNQLESEVERLRTERASQSSISDDLTKLKVSSAQQISQLKDTIDKLEHTNQDLHISLNNTAYQIRHLLQHFESQSGSLPTELQPDNDLTKNAHTPSSLSHDKVVFNSISELQQRNQELMIDIHHLSTQLEEKSVEANTYAASAKDANALLTDTSAKATTLIHEQNEKLKALEIRLSMAISERDRLLKATPESNLDSVVPSSTGDLQEQLKSLEQERLTLATETEAYRQEVEMEIQELRQEIKNVNAQVTNADQKYNQSLMEISQLKQRNIVLVQVSSSRQSELEELRKHTSIREGYVGELEGRILALKDEILSLNRTIENLHNDNLSTTAQLKASKDSYQRLLLENKELMSHRTHLGALLQDMNENMGNSASGTTNLIKELNQHNERLSGELQNLRDLLATKEKQFNELKASDKQEWRSKCQIANDELKRLKTEYLDLEKKLADANQNRLVIQKKLDEMTQSTQHTATGDLETTGTDSGAAAADEKEANDELSEQTKQLADANDLVVSLKKELIGLKERLADAETTTATVTSNYDQFTKESHIRIDKLSNDLTTSNAKVNSIQLELEKTLTEQKETTAAHISTQQQLLSANANLTKEKEEWQAKITTLSNRINDLETELATNAQQMQQAEQRYQEEVSGRAQDANTIVELRDKVETMNTAISTSESQVQDARDRLEAAESSYKNQKERWESVQNDLKSRLCESERQQESLSAKIQALASKLNQLQPTSDPVDLESITNLVGSATQQIQDMNASLRREKNIWQARYTDAQQHATRAEADLEATQQQLSTTKVLLDNMRTETIDSTKKQHQGIKDAINEAALYKENNVVLRSKVEQLEKNISRLESQSATKEIELEPLMLKAQGLEQELAKSKDLVKTLQMKHEALSTRSASAPQEQTKQDSRELGQLKIEMTSVKAQLDEKVKALESLEKQHQELLARSNRAQEQLKQKTELYVQRSKLALEYKKKATELETMVKAQKEQLDEHQKKQAVEPQVKQEHDNSEKAKDNSGKLKEMEDALKNQKDEQNALAIKYHNLLARAKKLTEEKIALSTNLEPLQKERTELKKQIESLTSEMEQLKQQLATKSEEAAKAMGLQVEIGRLKAMQSMANNKNEKLKKQVEDLQQKLEGHTPSEQNTATINTTATADSTNTLKRSPEEELDGQSPAKK